ncbi:transcriptional regulator protein [Novosphingobium sp. Rr 2-17]|uniref:hypothetical protein n=1 Tax=Novosphingobium sp. Rr 2-17 TaxID=555793 RepID=UPI000269A80E|nr:hypothetical protein [Novosphingobium sp. Rr 2-17]EIZ79613.1 transcriptional regulator protein [Novosphingobium sp. Rr 2-17]
MPLDFVRIALPAGAKVTMPASAYAFLRQIIWILDDDLVFVERGARHLLSIGDCLELGPPVDCAFHNESARICDYAVIALRTA